MSWKLVGDTAGGVLLLSVEPEVVRVKGWPATSREIALAEDPTEKHPIQLGKVVWTGQQSGTLRLVSLFYRGATVAQWVENSTFTVVQGLVYDAEGVSIAAQHIIGELPRPPSNSPTISPSKGCTCGTWASPWGGLCNEDYCDAPNEWSK